MSETSISLNLEGRLSKITVPYTAFSAFAAVTGDVELFSLPASGIIHMVKVKHSTGFVAGSQTTCLASVGVSGNLAKYHPVYQIDATANPVSDTTFNLNNVMGSENHGAVASIRIALTSNVNLNTLSAGSVDVWVWYVRAS